jgi:mannose-6-phosphate isomerase-like protein (cupin superfamily)
MRLVVMDSVPSDGTVPIERRDLASVLDTQDIAVNHYRVPPGNGLPSGLHTHMDQEEVFVVLSGTATFETFQLPAVSGDSNPPSQPTGDRIEVESGAIVRFAPGEFQTGWNHGDTDLVVLALGAPRESTDVRIPVPCEECAAETLRLETGGDGLRFACPECHVRYIPEPCPDCGGSDLHVTLGDSHKPVVVCDNCGTTFNRPPMHRNREESGQ